MLSRNVNVRKSLSHASIGSGSYSVTVEDSLRYASKAIKGGETYVNTALMRAANSVNANINNYVERHSTDGNWFA